MMNKLLWLMILFYAPFSFAGYFEVSGSGSYRRTNQDKNNYSIYRSATGSVAYYFWELSALEVSYTKARTDEVKTDYNARGFVEFYGADLIFTLASKKSLFQPYVKIGAAYQIKTVSYKQLNFDVTQLPKVEGWAPSGGAGFKIILGENWAIKTGVDVWSSPLKDDDVTYDYAARAGLSFIF